MEPTGVRRPTCLAAKNRDEATRAASRSGGVFTELARDVLRRRGAVYGCALDDDFTARHVRAASVSELAALRGSKYVQSDLAGIWSPLESDLRAGRPILFSGTPCQVAAVRSFVKAKGLPDEGLLYVDLVCHGVPSPAVWQKFLRESAEKWGGAVEGALFRDKERFGWKAHQETVLVKGVPHSSRTFARLFYSHLILRPSCFECPYKSLVRQGDVTLADFWGIDEAIPGFNDDKGVSLVLTSSQKGSEAFDRAKSHLEYREVSVESCLQPGLVAPFAAPEKREEFWRDYPHRSIWWLEKKYVSKPLWRRALTKLKRFVTTGGKR